MFHVKQVIIKKINKNVVDSAKSNGKDDYVIWDNQIKGFGVRIYKRGTKSYILKYRNENRQSRFYTIGRHGQLTPDQAREMARQKFGEITRGLDPAEDRQLKRKEYTVAELCDYYLEEGCESKAASTLYTDKGRIKRHIKPLLGTKKISAVKHSHVEKMMHDIADGKTAIDERTGNKRGRAIVKGGKGVASKCVNLLGAIYTFAMRRDLVNDNPCRCIEKFPENRNERFLSQKEFKELADALKEAQEHDNEHPSAINAIRMLILTGCRKDEILTLKWDYVDFQNACLRLPTSKTGFKIVRVGAPALSIIESISKEKDNPYVFTGIKKNSHFVGLTKVWYRVRNKKECLQGLRLHDLRHSFASIGVGGGLSLPLIGSLLGHKHHATTARYAHLADDPVKAAVDQVSNQINTAMIGETAEIVSLEDRKKNKA